MKHIILNIWKNMCSEWKVLNLSHSTDLILPTRKVQPIGKFLSNPLLSPTRKELFLVIICERFILNLMFFIRTILLLAFTSSANCHTISFVRVVSKICTKTFCSTTIGFTRNYPAVRSRQYWPISKTHQSTTTTKIPNAN